MREAIVIIGMHRSGTSMVSGMLKLTGLDTGKNLWKPDHANPKGYFENSRIGIFNDELLAMLHATWHDTLNIPELWWETKEIDSQIDRFGEIIGDEFDVTSFLLFKDPRISILVPFYIRAFEKLGIKPYFLINFRDPFEVAASLKKRNNLAVSKGLLLWMDYTLKAERYTRGQPRMFIQYDKILADPEGFLKTVFSHFGLEYNTPPSHAKRIADFVEKELNHHSRQLIPANEQIPAEVNRLYDLVSSLNGKDTPKTYLKKFDEIAAEFYSECRFYQGVDETFEALLQVETTSMKRKTYTHRIHPGHNLLDFSLDGESPVTRIILNPCNQLTSMIIHNAAITDNRNQKSDIQPHYTNAEWSDPDGRLVFESETPEITYILGSPQILTRVAFDLTYFVLSSPTYRYGIHARDVAIDGLTDKNTKSHEQIQSGLKELDKLKEQQSGKTEEYTNTISLFRQQIETMSALITKHELIYRATVESKQSEIASKQSEIATLSTTMKKLESQYHDSIKSSRGEIERLNRQLDTNEAKSKMEIESRQSEIDRLSGDIQRIREEMNQALEEKQKDISQLQDLTRQQQTDFSQETNALNRELEQVRSMLSEKEYELTRIGSMLLEKEDELVRIGSMLSGKEKEVAEIRTLLQERERELTQFRFMLTAKEQELSVTLESYTWKTGKLLLAPVQFFWKKRSGN